VNLFLTGFPPAARERCVYSDISRTPLGFLDRELLGLPIDRGPLQTFLWGGGWAFVAYTSIEPIAQHRANQCNISMRHRGSVLGGGRVLESEVHDDNCFGPWRLLGCIAGLWGPMDVCFIFHKGFNGIFFLRYSAKGCGPRVLNLPIVVELWVVIRLLERTPRQALSFSNWRWGIWVLLGLSPGSMWKRGVA